MAYCVLIFMLYDGVMISGNFQKKEMQQILFSVQSSKKHRSCYVKLRYSYNKYSSV